VCRSSGGESHASGACLPIKASTFPPCWLLDSSSTIQSIRPTRFFHNGYTWIKVLLSLIMGLELVYSYSTRVWWNSTMTECSGVQWNSDKIDKLTSRSYVATNKLKITAPKCDKNNSMITSLRKNDNVQGGNVRSKVLMVPDMNWDAKVCSVVNRCRHLCATCHLHLHGPKMDTGSFSELLVWIYQLHCIASQKIVIFEK
jgi:hypothetical protein